MNAPGDRYAAISSDFNFHPGKDEDTSMHFSIPLGSAWIVDHDDKPRTRRGSLRRILNFKGWYS